MTSAGPSPPSLTHLRRLTDGRGLWQHARHAVPDRRHGYCLDDNARALWLCARLAPRGAPAPAPLVDLATVYAGFVDHVWDAQAGRFCNFLAHDGAFLGDEAAAGEDEDATARALLALVVAATSGLPDGVAGWAADRASEVLPVVSRHRSPRAWCWSLAACAHVLEAGEPHGLHERAGAVGRDLAARLLARWHDAARPDWPWFEDALAYDNARLAQGALDGARFEPALLDVGLRALDWLCAVQTGPGGVHRPVGSEGFGRPHAAPARFAQQPLDAWASVEACMAAWRLTGEARWRGEAERALAWFAGRNDARRPLADPDEGSCRDGIDPQGVSVNRGAESTLAWLHARTCMGADG